MADPGPTNCRDCGAYYREHRSELIGVRDDYAAYDRMLDAAIEATAADLGLPVSLVRRLADIPPLGDPATVIAEWFVMYHNNGHAIGSGGA